MQLVKRLYLTPKRDIIFLALYAALFVFLLRTPVNSITNALLPEETITVSVKETGNPGDSIWLCRSNFNEDDEENCFTRIAEGEFSGQWEYRDMETFQYSHDVIILYAQDQPSSVTFSVPVSSRHYVRFSTNPGGLVATVSSGDRECEVDLRSENSGELKFYPFSSRIFPVLLKISLYLAAYILLLGLLFALLPALKKVAGHPLLSRPVKRRDLFLLWAGLYVFAVLQYIIGNPNSHGLEVGDAAYYWSIWLMNLDRWWDPAVFCQNTLSARGYICHVIPVLSHLIGNKLGLDPFCVYFIFPSFAIAWLTAYVIPQFYEVLTGRKAMISQAAAFLVIYMFFWNGTLTAVLVDLFSSVSFIAGLMFAVRFWKDRSAKDGCAVGFFWGLAINYRPTYKYGIYVILIVAAIYSICGRRRTKDPSAGRMWRKNVKGALLAAFMFCIVATPQLQVNLAQGHIGLIPYDQSGNGGLPISETLDDSSRTASVLEFGGNYTFMYGYTGYPYPVSDTQISTMKLPFFNSDQVLTVPQVLEVYINSPIESLICIAKKLLISFDLKTNITYPKVIDWRETSGLLFSFLNYSVLICATYCVFVHKKMQLIEKVLFACLFIGLVLPYMYVHVEWRYLLVPYIFLYYVFSYHFVGEQIVCAKECGQKIESRYLFGFLAAIVISFLISLSIYP